MQKEQGASALFWWFTPQKETASFKECKGFGLLK
jgi:hypothetical protein